MARTQDVLPQMSHYHLHYTRFILRVVACVFEFIAFWLAIDLGVNVVDADVWARYQFPCVSISDLSYVNGPLLVNL
jgi:hypothetical protein